MGERRWPTLKVLMPPDAFARIMEMTRAEQVPTSRWARDRLIEALKSPGTERRGVAESVAELAAWAGTAARSVAALEKERDQLRGAMKELAGWFLVQGGPMEWLREQFAPRWGLDPGVLEKAAREWRTRIQQRQEEQEAERGRTDDETVSD